MKVIVNIETKFLPKVREWFECEGVKLVEDHDGSFSLWITTDMESARRVDETNAALRSHLGEIAGRDAP